MKKLLFLSIVAIFALVSATVNAQSTGTAPAPGATQNYAVTSHGTNTYSWKVTKGADLSTSSSDATIATATAAATNITWGAGVTIGDWYYVHVVETTTGSCSNEKVLPVHITASPFFLTLTAPSPTACYNGAVTVSLADPSTPNYNHGNTTIVFTITPTGLSSSYIGYTFVLATLDVPANFNATAIYSSNASIAAGKVTVSDNAPVTITYTVNNTNVYTNASAANAQDYTATATISAGKTINGISDNGTGSKTGATAVSRPNTSGITTN